jgi:hypothetical protein
MLAVKFLGKCLITKFDDSVREHMTVSCVCVATIIRLVLDWQLDLLDHTQLQCIHFTTHYCSYNSSLKTAARPEYSLVTGTVHVTNSTLSISEDFGSNSATNSYGVPCHHSLTSCPRSCPAI